MLIGYYTSDTQCCKPTDLLINVLLHYTLSGTAKKAHLSPSDSFSYKELTSSSGTGVVLYCFDFCLVGTQRLENEGKRVVGMERVRK